VPRGNTDAEAIVQSISKRVVDADAVPLDTLIHDTVTEHTNHWGLSQCFDVIDASDCVTARQIGEQQSHGELSHVDGNTTIEREIRHWAGVALVERGLDHVDGEEAMQTVAM